MAYLMDTTILSEPRGSDRQETNVSASCEAVHDGELSPYNEADVTGLGAKVLNPFG